MDLRIQGPVSRPEDKRYDAAIATWRPQIEQRRMLVAEACGPDDVRAVVLWAREHDVPLAVQSTGHAGPAPSDAVLLKTSLLGSVLVDPDRQVARVGAGARWSDVVAAADPFGLVPLSGAAPSVGVAGYTMGGGLSWLSRRYGFAADSVLRVTVVLADGRIVTASRDQHPDLFWALRGGGGNFGVVTSLEFRLYRLPSVHAGVATFPRTVDRLGAYRDWALTAPDELSTAVIARNDVIELHVMHAGDGTVARRLLRQLRRTTGAPIRSRFGQVRFADARMPRIAPHGFELFDELPDAALATVAAAQATFEVRHWGGALSRPAVDAGPVSHRGTAFSITVDGPPDITTALRPYAAGGTFVNFLVDPARTPDGYVPDDYARLRQVKAAVDPNNIFRPARGIPPAIPARRRRAR
jgi:FAD/FMN-containing dehydrogenase